MISQVFVYMIKKETVFAQMKHSILKIVVGMTRVPILLSDYGNVVGGFLSYGGGEMLKISEMF